MTVRLLATCSPGEIRIAATNGDRLLDYALWRPGLPDGVGDLLRGRVQSVVPAMGGVFVALPDAIGFLPVRGQDPALNDGDPVLVTIVRSAQGGKGPRLTRAVSDQALDGAPVLLQPGPDPLARLVSAHPEASILIDDPALAAGLAPTLRKRMSVVADPIPPAVIQQIDVLSETEIALPGGMRASVYPTPALVAIDMDGGSSSATRATKQTAQFAANRAAIGPLLHQIRLRNLSGAILIDLAGLGSRKRTALRPDIEAALALDPLRPKLLGFTALGLAEILRPRLHPPLHELLRGPHAAALSALREAVRFAATPPHRLPGLIAGFGVATALDHDRFAMQALVRRTGRSLSIHVDPSLHPNGWRLDHA